MVIFPVQVVFFGFYFLIWAIALYVLFVFLFLVRKKLICEKKVFNWNHSTNFLALFLSWTVCNNVSKWPPQKKPTSTQVSISTESKVMKMKFFRETIITFHLSKFHFLNFVQRDFSKNIVINTIIHVFIIFLIRRKSFDVFRSWYNYFKFFLMKKKKGKNIKDSRTWITSAPKS